MSRFPRADRDHLASDASDAAAWLTRRFPRQPLLILAHSEGTTLAPLVAASQPCHGLLLLGVVGRSMHEVLRHQIGSEGEYHEALRAIESDPGPFAPDGKPLAWYRQYLAAPANAELLAAVKAPLAIFQGEDDVQTPPAEALSIVARRPAILRLYPGLGHGFSRRKDGKPTLGPIEPQVLEDVVSMAEQCCSCMPPNV